MFQIRFLFKQLLVLIFFFSFLDERKETKENQGKRPNRRSGPLCRASASPSVTAYVFFVTLRDALSQMASVFSNWCWRCFFSP
jgi:hypothetical protein